MGNVTVSKAQKIGGSIFARIPMEIVAEESLEENQKIIFEIEKLRKSWFGAFKGIGPFTSEDEMKAHD